MDVGRMLGTVTALFALAAGMLHVSAAGDHTDHEYAVVFFVVVAALQLAWAGGMLAGRDSRRWLVLGAALNVAVAGVWVLSRTAGVPFVPEVSEVEAVGVKDSITTLLGLLAAGGAAVLGLLPNTARRAELTVGPRAVAVTAAMVFTLAVPGVLAGHGEGHVHGALAGSSHAHSGDDHHDAGTAAAHAHTDADNHPSSGDAAHAHAAAAAADSDHGHNSATAHSDADHAAHAAPTKTTPASSPAAVNPDELGQRAVVRYPILLLPPSLGGAEHRNLVYPALPKPCENCFITWMKPDLVTADGRSANVDRGMMLHHTVLAQPDRADATCSRNSGVGFVGERFFAAGNERTILTLPKGYGYKVGAMPWVGIFEIMNHSDAPQLVFFELEVRYRPASANLKPVTPLWLDMDNCADSAYPIGAGRTTGTWRWQSNLTGRIVAAGGHVHDGGIAITTSNRTTKQRICRSVAGYNNKPAYEGTIDTMSTCIWDRIGSIRAGEVLELTTDYNSSIPQPDVMGIVIAYLYQTTDVLGGTSAPADVVDPSDGSEAAPPPPVHQH